MSELFGIVKDSMKLPASESVLVVGDWLTYDKSALTPPYDFKIIQFRNCSIIGEWKIESASIYPSKENVIKRSLTFKPLNGSLDFQRNDLFFSEDLYIDIKIASLSRNFDSSYKIGFHEENDVKYGVILEKQNDGYIAAICSQFPNELDSLKQINFTSLDTSSFITENFNVDINESVNLINSQNPLEVKFEYENVILLKDFMNAMDPLRSFIIDSSQEYFYSFTSKSYDMRAAFEPTLQLKAGSVRVFLSPLELNDSQPDLMSYSNPDFGYRLLYSALEYAEKRDSKSLINLLSSNKLTSIRPYLEKLKKVARTFEKTSEFKLIHKNMQPLQITKQSVVTISNALDDVESKAIEIVGILYAVDTIRRWFKVYDNETNRDWKFIYDKDYELEVFNNRPLVNVTGTTEQPLDSKRGTAKLVAIEVIE